MRHVLNELGFEGVSITKKDKSEEIIKSWNMGEGTERLVFSGYVTAKKPREAKAVEEGEKWHSSVI